MSRDRNITGDNKEFNKSPRIKPDTVIKTTLKIAEQEKNLKRKK